MDRSRSTICLARSPDLNSVHLYLWAHLKSIVYRTLTIWKHLVRELNTQFNYNLKSIYTLLLDIYRVVGN